MRNGEPEATAEREYEFDPERIVTRSAGRRGWLREADRQLEQQRWENPDEIARSRADRLLLAAARLEDDLAAERAGNEAYEAYREQGRMRDGRRFGRPPDPHQPPEVPEGKVNITDPDSKPHPDWVRVRAGLQRAGRGERATHRGGGGDHQQVDRLLAALTRWWKRSFRELERAGADQPPETVAADAGYWNERHIDEVVADKHIQALVAPDKGSRGTPRKTWTGPRYDFMRAVLQSDAGGERYRKRKQTVEPLFGNTKHNKGVTRFLRRGRIKVRTEWRLHMMAHNLAKLHRHQTAALAA